MRAREREKGRERERVRNKREINTNQKSQELCKGQPTEQIRYIA